VTVVVGRSVVMTQSVKSRDRNLDKLYSLVKKLAQLGLNYTRAVTRA